MTQKILRISAVLFIMGCVSLLPAQASDPIVFISAFAPGDQGAIHAYSLALDRGELKQLHRTAGAENAFFMALSPSKKYLYAIHAPGEFGTTNNEQVAAYEVIGDRGELKLLNRQPAMGSAACYLDVDRTGKTVVLANYQTGSVAAFPVQDDGSLDAAASFVQHAGSSINPDRQEGPHAHSIVVSPDNRFVLAADLGLDQILSYRLDADTAKLTANDVAFAKAPPGAGPRHLTFHPSTKYVYVINELKNSVTLFDFDSQAGTLSERQTISTLPAEFVGTSYCADLKITPDGQFLYGTNRGHDSVAAYRIAEDGTLQLLEIEPSLGQGPQNLAITSDGKWLLCANMPGNNVVVFQIDGQTGKINPIGDPISMPSPSCIMMKN